MPFTHKHPVQSHHGTIEGKTEVANRTRIYTGLLDASYALDEHAAGRVPELSRLISGAITLDTLFRRRALDADLQDAALILERAARESQLYLDAAGKARAATLADKIRRLANNKVKGDP
ncbi:hypothetical protein P9281_02910 [Caballeronia sp. LP003]|uniref:hypothetical protein n=1 Tax=Caballeronia sp. LP003 TaxID=3038551 RepID=UPI0028650716|nr:hypothetical protein [Caballeronia sp. LP003]MDR5785501.1 hypothetical protein [Caballeronia sp. LP003]